MKLEGKPPRISIPRVWHPKQGEMLLNPQFHHDRDPLQSSTVFALMQLSLLWQDPFQHLVTIWVLEHCAYQLQNAVLCFQTILKIRSTKHKNVAMPRQLRGYQQHSCEVVLSFRYNHFSQQIEKESDYPDENKKTYIIMFRLIPCCGYLDLHLCSITKTSSKQHLNSIFYHSQKIIQCCRSAVITKVLPV